VVWHATDTFPPTVRAQHTPLQGSAMVADTIPWKTGNVALTLGLFENGITAPSEFAEIDECRVGTVEFGLAGHIEQSFQWFSHLIFIPFSMFVNC